jgi:isocitrate/isopropylmalate dehydrogenase
MENINTFEKVSEALRELAEKREVVSPEKWMAGAIKLNILLESEVEKLIELEFIVAQKRRQLLDQGNSVAYCKSMVEATEEYKAVRLQQAKIDNAKQTILIAKKYAQLASEQMRSNL